MSMLRTLLAAALAAALAACAAPNTPPPAAELAVIDAPDNGARVTSPLTITGTAPADWYFENQFPVRLLDAQGAVIAESPAIPRVNWTENAEPKVFDARALFVVAQDTPATIVLEEAMADDGGTPREVRIDVVLVAR